MTKPTPEQIYEAALKVANKQINGLAEAYAAACKRYAADYEELPDGDDLFAWLEGHDWQHSKSC